MATPTDPRYPRRLLLLLVCAAMVRLAYLAQASTLPLLEAPLYDSEVYLHQARQLRAGHFGDPSLVAFSPLYGWLLAVLGGRMAVAIAAQLVLGMATLALLVRLARARAGEAAALGCGALWLGYGLPLFYETKVLSETLGLALALAGLALALASDRRASSALAAASGAVLGLSALARASLLFSLPLYPLALLIAPPSPEPSPPPPDRAGGAPGAAAPRSLARPGPRRRRAALMAAGIAVVLGGNGLWNRAHTGLFVPVILVSRTAALATGSGWTGDFRIFGDPRGDGDVSPWDVVRQAADRIAEARAGVAPAGPGRPLWGVDVAGYLRGLPGKLARTLADRETTFDYGYYGERSEVTVLRALPVSFGLLEVLALVGLLGLWWRQGGAGLRAVAPLLPLILGTLVTTTLFYPTSRYRLPMALPLALLAAECVPLLRWQAGRWQPRVRALLAACLVGFGLRTVLRAPEQPADWQLRVAEAATATGDVAEADRRIERARALAPADPQVAHRIAVIRRARGR